MEELKKIKTIQKALEFLEQDDENTLREHLLLCTIPAPSFKEQERAFFVMEKMKEYGLEEVHQDAVGNVLGLIRGRGDGPRVILAAHLDTVFPMETELSVRKEGNRYYCPGINDDTRALAELLSLARAMKALDIRGNGDLIFCANVCEEGLGDLKGVRHIFGASGCCDAFVTVDNVASGGIVYTATGSVRYLVTFRGPGGHSFGDFGLPNPIHAMGRAISAIGDFQVKDSPRTTFNVGVVEGGTSVNSIPQECSMLVDLRSDDAQELQEIEKKFLAAVEEAVKRENERWGSGKKVTVTLTLKGSRPAGRQERESQIVRAAWAATLASGQTPEFRRECSTDANIPISLGIPAIALGRGGAGGGTHTLGEWFSPQEAYKGPQKLLLLALGLLGYGDFVKYQL
ncbi:MAG: M20/M25/M40 family metallo-hydrolase [Eubacteriales bacterium]|nr:M20/M25/M40 family metallo-hydrolase [Eubacteriales bacterium]